MPRTARAPKAGMASALTRASAAPTPLAALLAQQKQIQAQIEQYQKAEDGLKKLATMGLKITPAMRAAVYDQLNLPAVPTRKTQVRATVAPLAERETRAFKTKRAHVIKGKACLLCGGQIRAKRSDAKFCGHAHTNLYHTYKKRGPEVLKRLIAKFRREQPDEPVQQLPNDSKARVVGHLITKPTGQAAVSAKDGKTPIKPSNVHTYTLKCEHGGHEFKSVRPWTRWCSPAHKYAWQAEAKKAGIPLVRYTNRSAAQKARFQANPRRDRAESPESHAETNGDHTPSKTHTRILLPADPLRASLST